jgi:hypothetical protein
MQGQGRLGHAGSAIALRRVPRNRLTGLAFRRRARLTDA